MPRKMDLKRDILEHIFRHLRDSNITYFNIFMQV